MARKMCPRCNKVVEVKVTREGNVVTKSCPDCGFVFIKYEIGKRVLVFNNESVPDAFPPTKANKLF